MSNIKPVLLAPEQDIPVESPEDLPTAGSCHLSKLSQLKQDAYQAGKDRNWEQAISVYEQILEIDKKNPTLVNELGDVCLKSNEITRAVRHFINAAAMYRKNGLVNNAVAIYKKILRHDPTNMNAHWYLAESRAGQGLKVEGRAHALTFLSRSDQVAGELKEIYLKRCMTLLELYQDSEDILEKLVQIFRMWEMFLEAGRAEILLCCVHFEADGSAAEADVAALVEREATIVNYPEYARWRQLIDPPTADAPAGSYVDFGAVDLGDQDVLTSPEKPETPTASPAASTIDETSFANINMDDGLTPEPQINDKSNFSDLGNSSSVGNPEPETAADETSFSGLDSHDSDHDTASKGNSFNIDPLAMEKDEDGCISIDTESSGDMSDLLADAVEHAGDNVGPAPVEAPSSGTPVSSPGEGNINLLEQILAEDEADLLGMENKQLETITAEIGAQVGGDDEDKADRQYEMGLVYLEMGMLDKAVESFQSASADAEFAARAYEMWSMALERGHRLEEAIAVLRSGVAADAVDKEGNQGLLYHLGKLLEHENRMEEAGDCYDRILAVDADYMDVSKRRSRLPIPT